MASGCLVALQLEFENYLELLSFEAEHQLTSEPLRIDVLIIKKDKHVFIDNPIGNIFKTINLFEYKSPTDKLTVDHFDKGLVYVLMYKLLHNKKAHRVALSDISLTFVITNYPQSVITCVKRVWKGTVTEPQSGIYRIKGFPFPVQIIDTTKISEETHAFLKVLNNNLDEKSLTFVLNEKHRPHKVDISPLVDVVVRANPQGLKEILMKEPTLEQVLDELGITARAEKRGEIRGEKRGEERGEKRAKVQFAKKLIQKGWNSAEIAETTGLDLLTVESLYMATQS